MHRNTLNNIIIMKHAQKYTKQYNNNETCIETQNNIIIMKHAQKYTKQYNNNETCIEIHKTI